MARGEGETQKEDGERERERETDGTAATVSLLTQVHRQDVE
ncbi:hypothetical protein KIPB_010968, partial [Kipferlia bialata]|eukprot:g10968.t1